MSIRMLLIVGTLMTPLTAGAAGLDFLRNSPVYYFTAADRKLMNDAAAAVLNDADASAVREWSNPRTGYSGKVQGMGRFRSPDGLECRKVKLWNRAKGIESEAVYPACRDKEGRWRLASGVELTAA